MAVLLLLLALGLPLSVGGVSVTTTGLPADNMISEAALADPTTEITFVFDVSDLSPPSLLEDNALPKAAIRNSFQGGTEWNALRSLMINDNDITSTGGTTLTVVVKGTAGFNVPSDQTVNVVLDQSLVGGECGISVTVTAFTIKATTLTLVSLVPGGTNKFLERNVRNGFVATFQLKWGTFVTGPATGFTASASAGWTDNGVTLADLDGASDLAVFTFPAQAAYDLTGGATETITIELAADHIVNALGAAAAISASFTVYDTTSSLDSATLLSEEDIQQSFEPTLLQYTVAAVYTNPGDTTALKAAIRDGLVGSGSETLGWEGLNVKTTLIADEDISIGAVGDSTTVTININGGAGVYSIQTYEDITITAPAGLTENGAAITIGTIRIVPEYTDTSGANAEYGVTLTPKVPCSKFTFAETIFHVNKYDGGEAPETIFGGCNIFDPTGPANAGYQLIWRGGNRAPVVNNAHVKLIADENEAAGWNAQMGAAVLLGSNAVPDDDVDAGDPDAVPPAIGKDNLYILKTPGYDITADEKVWLSFAPGVLVQNTATDLALPAGDFVSLYSGLDFPGYFTVKATKITVSPTDISELQVMRGDWTATFTIEAVDGTQDLFGENFNTINALDGGALLAFAGGVSVSGANSAWWANLDFGTRSHVLQNAGGAFTEGSFADGPGLLSSQMSIVFCNPQYAGANEMCPNSPVAPDGQYDISAAETITFTIPPAFLRYAPGDVAVTGGITVHPITIAASGTFVDGTKSDATHIQQGGSTVVLRVSGDGDGVWFADPSAQFFTDVGTPFNDFVRAAFTSAQTDWTDNIATIIPDSSIWRTATAIYITFAAAPAFTPSATVTVQIDPPKELWAVDTDVGDATFGQVGSDITIAVGSATKAWNDGTTTTADTDGGFGDIMHVDRILGTTPAISLELTIDGVNWKTGAALSDNLKQSIRAGVYNDGGDGFDTPKGWNLRRDIIIDHTAISATGNVLTIPLGTDASFEPNFEEVIRVLMPCTALDTADFCSLPYSCPIDFGTVTLKGVDPINFACKFSSVSVLDNTRHIQDCSWTNTKTGLKLQWQKSVPIAPP
eukprot:TRINITY_DN67051_c7_g6_i1.p1 TRINITY_DN67051_c7_g6~~TRINITY_DN67051_c7_g6_i1.p1  ORF type:complete len:1077 (-),score=154.12 TRINITY_DN67051_c7_g6_i1:230-3460(-)